MERSLPEMPHLSPRGGFETAMHWGASALPGLPGFICYRKLKRRYRQRLSGDFAKMLDLVGPGDLCIDLGANLGEVSTQLLETGADVIAFEPDPDTCARLRAALGDNPRLTIHEKAAAAEAGTFTLRRSTRMGEDPDRFSQSASLVRADATMSDEDAVQVEVVDFPKFLTDLDRDVRLLKMDIEGSEWALMAALIDHPVLQRIDAIFVETHEWMNPARYMPLARRLQQRAEAMRRPYINLFWH
jgi:FkbM family methyltransferase